MSPRRSVPGRPARARPAPRSTDRLRARRRARRPLPHRPRGRLRTSAERLSARASSSLISLMIVTPVSESPAMSARSTGAAPRQRGRSDGWTLSHSRSASTSSGTIKPYATATTVGAPTSRPSWGESGSSTGIPSRRAVSLAGERASLRPLPAGASGRVISERISCRSARRSRTSAPNAAVAATAIGRVNARRERAAA